MSPPPASPISSVPTAEENVRIRTFLDRVFWALGVFCFLWSESALIGVLRRRDSDLPIIGKTQINETIVFTLLVLCALLPILLWVVHTYRSAAKRYRWETQFPGTPSGEWEIPASFKRLRAGIFVVLVVFPAATMVYLCASIPREMKFKDIRNSKDGPNDDPKIVVQLTGAQMFFGPAKSFKQTDHDWRWIEIGTNDTEMKSEARPSAYRWQPWAFCAITCACAGFSLFYLFTSAVYVQPRKAAVKTSVSHPRPG